MLKYRNIGIKKDISLRMVFCGIPLIVLLFLSVVFWGFYLVDDSKDDLLIKYGIEVEAEIYEYFPSWHGEETGYRYETKYRYISPDGGSIYSGNYLEYGSADDAAKHIGDKIIITIVPDSVAPGEYISVPKKYADLNGPKYNLHLALAISCTVPTPFLIYLLCYRGFYRNELDKKIIMGFEQGYLPERRGEVVKVCGWLVNYVKVRYEDKGETCERWARSWFTRKEAKYLKQKQFIKIVPYKKNYGILEEMPVENKSKKYDT